jgi:response regulator of citrate/malate metabolism
MSHDLLRARNQLKARWLAANKRALAFRRKATEAEKEAAALQKALDALEAAAPRLGETETAAPLRQQAGAAVQRMIGELKARGPLTAKQLAEATGINYFTITKHLQRGSFKVAGTVQNGGRTSQTWTVAEATPAS